MIPQELFSTAKDVLAGTLEASGLLWRRLDQALDGRVLVLMYHRVLPQQDRDSFSSPGIIVTPETFDRHLGWIRSHFQPLSSHEFGAVIYGGRKPPKRACLITFDDGWWDNLSLGLPALERHGVPAILFATTGFVGTPKCFWQERLGRLLNAAWQVGPSGTAVLRLVGAESAQHLNESRARTVIFDAIQRLKALSPLEIESRLATVEMSLSNLQIELPSNYGDDRFLSWPQLQQMAASRLVTIGSHAVSHAPLPRLPPPRSLRSYYVRARPCKQVYPCRSSGSHIRTVITTLPPSTSYARLAIAAPLRL